MKRSCLHCGRSTHWLGARCLRCWKKATVADLTPMQRLIFLALKREKGSVDLLLIAVCFGLLALFVFVVVSWSESSLRAALALGDKL